MPICIDFVAAGTTVVAVLAVGALHHQRANGGEEGRALHRPWCLHPECSQKHLSGFVENAAQLRAKGVDTVACVSVNDAFVMKAWKERLGLGNDVLLLSDGNVELTCVLDVEMDLSEKPMGLDVRSRRYSLRQTKTLLRSHLPLHAHGEEPMETGSGGLT